MILAVSLAMGLGVAQVPEVLQHLPELLKSVLSFGVATGGITAMVLNLLLPRRCSGLSHSVHVTVDTKKPDAYRSGFFISPLFGPRLNAPSRRGHVGSHMRIILVISLTEIVEPGSPYLSFSKRFLGHSP